MSPLPTTYNADVKVRVLKPDEVFIKVKASGLCGSDCFIQNGTWPVDYPRIPGHEVIGRIVALGSAVELNRLKFSSLVGVGWSGGYCKSCARCRKGDFAGCIISQYNGFASDYGHGGYMYAPETAVIQIPEEAHQTASCAELAPLLCGGTTVHGVIRSSDWNPGDIAIVQGIPFSGGLGHLAIQYATKLGPKVYAVSSVSSKAELAKSLGAVAHVDASTTDVVAYFQALGGAKLHCTACQTHIFNSSCCIDFSFLAGAKSMVKTYSIEQFKEAYEDLVQGKPQFHNVIVFPRVEYIVHCKSNLNVCLITRGP
ncbi:hypothetical protein ACEPAF_3599 [Sanghuangporus sanghuang]